MTLEVIFWHDVFSHDAWCALRDMGMSPKKIMTIGLVIKENDETVAVTHTYSEDNDQDESPCTMVIPKALIYKREMMLDEKRVAEWYKLTEQA